MLAITTNLISKRFTLLLIKSLRNIKWSANSNHGAMSSMLAKVDLTEKETKKMSLITKFLTPSCEVNHNQLPKQPVPELKKTLFKYLKSLEPILNSKEYDQTVSYVEEFIEMNNPNNECSLQKILKKIASLKENWAHEIYVDDYYLNVKLPLPIYSNPAKIMQKQTFKDENSFLKYVTFLVKATLDFKTKIDTNQLKIDKANAYRKGQDLCMDQYTKIFSSYRIPGIDKDKFKVYNNEISNQHIIILSRNQLYKIDLIVNNCIIDELDLFHQLKYIRDESKKHFKKNKLDVGLLTSLPRDEWAKIRNNLKKDSTNQESFELIEKSAFLICLDDKIEDKIFSNEHIKNGNQILNGCGTGYNSANRWFDKTLQFIVSEDGVCGLLREHSPSEGPITVNLIDHIYEYLNKPKYLDFSESYPFTKPFKLKWNKTEYLETEIEKARNKFDQLIDDFDLNVFKYEKYGKLFPKKLNMSPDSFLQVAIQYAYFKMYEKLPVHISIGSMRRFHKGRVDYIRATNIDSLKWCNSMKSSSNLTIEEKFFLFKKTVESQTKTMIETILGNGYDCHLAALKNIAIQERIEMPNIFKDPSFDLNNQIKLLTSQVTTEFDGTFSCFGPNVNFGYTSTYNYKPNHILFTLSSFKSCSSNSVKVLTKAFEESLDELYLVCTHNNGK